MEHPPDPPAGDERPPVVDFGLLGRRLRRTALVLAALIVGTVVVLLPLRGLDLVLVRNLTGLGLAVLFIAEVVIVGGSAVRGLLRAGERGDRLASDGVGLLPPQITRGGGTRRTS